jgi:hypothetical protein
MAGPGGTEMHELDGEFLQHRAGLVEHCGIAADEEREPALVGARCAAGHAAIEIVAAGGADHRAEPQCLGWKGCGEIAKDLPRTRRGEETALAGQDLLDLRRGGHDEDDDVA